MVQGQRQQVLLRIHLEQAGTQQRAVLQVERDERFGFQLAHLRRVVLATDIFEADRHRSRRLDALPRQALSLHEHRA